MGAVISCVGVRAATTRPAKVCWAAFGRGGEGEGQEAPPACLQHSTRQGSLTGLIIQVGYRQLGYHTIAKNGFTKHTANQPAQIMAWQHQQPNRGGMLEDYQLINREAN